MYYPLILLTHFESLLSSVFCFKETVAALMSIGKDGEEEEEEEEDQDLNGLALVNNRPIDFSGGAGLDGEPMDEVRINLFCYTDG